MKRFDDTEELIVDVVWDWAQLARFEDSICWSAPSREDTDGEWSNERSVLGGSVIANRLCGRTSTKGPGSGWRHLTRHEKPGYLHKLP